MKNSGIGRRVMESALAVCVFVALADLGRSGAWTDEQRSFHEEEKQRQSEIAVGVAQQVESRGEGMLDVVVTLKISSVSKSESSLKEGQVVRVAFKAPGPDVEIADYGGPWLPKVGGGMVVYMRGAEDGLYRLYDWHPVL